MRGQSRKLRSDMTSNRVGAGAGLYRLATQANMRGFDVFGNWATAQITAADQARFFAQLEELTPARYREYARQLLSSVVRSRLGDSGGFASTMEDVLQGRMARDHARTARSPSRLVRKPAALGRDRHSDGRQSQSSIRTCDHQGYCNSPPRRLEPCAVLRSRSVVWARQHREVYK
jgi:hypothetical protein